MMAETSEPSNLSDFKEKTEEKQEEKNEKHEKKRIRKAVDPVKPDPDMTDTVEELKARVATIDEQIEEEKKDLATATANKKAGKGGYHSDLATVRKRLAAMSGDMPTAFAIFTSIEKNDVAQKLGKSIASSSDLLAAWKNLSSTRQQEYVSESSRRQSARNEAIKALKEEERLAQLAAAADKKSKKMKKKEKAKEKEKEEEEENDEEVKGAASMLMETREVASESDVVTPQAMEA